MKPQTDRDRLLDALQLAARGVPTVGAIAAVSASGVVSVGSQNVS
jgi:hypothetical protein